MSLRLPILLIGLVLVAGFSLLRNNDPSLLHSLRDAYFDTLQRISPRSVPPTRVYVVDIDEASLAEVGEWPWPRDILADLTNRLGEAGATAIAYDLIFAGPDRLSPLRLTEDPRLSGVLSETATPETLQDIDTDAAFAAAIANAPVVLSFSGSDRPYGGAIFPKFGVVEIGENPNHRLYELLATTTLEPRLYEAASGVGAISVLEENSGAAARRIPLIWSTPNGVMQSLALEALRVSMGEPNLVMKHFPKTGEIEIHLDEFVIPLTPEGALWLNTRWQDETKHISAHEILNGPIRPELDGAIVLVGTSAAGLLDLWTTVLGETVPGVEIHAQAIEQILTGQHLKRPQIAKEVEILLFISAGLLVTAVMSLSGPLVAVLSGGLAVALIFLSSWIGFRQGGLLIDATFPFLATTIVFSLLSVYRLFVTDREARRIRRLFSHYVAPDVLRDIERDRHKVALGGIDQPVTVMFSDIRNFTELSGALDAQSVVAILNRLFAELSREIMSTRGTIDKYMGDSVMAFWNAPVPAHDHAARACRAALAMRDALRSFNARNVGVEPVQMGLGLDTGTVCVGNIGSSERFNYTAIGPAVNLAARLEAACRDIHFDILVTREVREAAPDFAWLPAGDLTAKGISGRIETYILVGDGAMRVSEPFDALTRAHTDLLEAVATGGDVDMALTRVMPLIADLPGLYGFYDAMRQRQDDFAVAV